LATSKFRANPFIPIGATRFDIQVQANSVLQEKL
jgi:hypothetical protein